MLTTAPAPAGSPLHNALCAAIARTWCTGRADFSDIAVAVVDTVAEHVRRHGVGGMDQRIAHAFADAVAAGAESDGATPADPLQQTIDLDDNIDPSETIIGRIGADGRAVEIRRLHRHRFGGAL